MAIQMLHTHETADSDPLICRLGKHNLFFLCVVALVERRDDWLEPGQLSFNAVLPSIFAQAVIVVLDQRQTPA